MEVKNGLYVIIVLLLISLSGCRTFGEADKYGTNYYPTDLIGEVCGFGGVFIVDSVRNSDFTLLLSKEGHFFLAPTDNLKRITDKTDESTIFQIPGAGLFSWRVLLVEDMNEADFNQLIQMLLYSYWEFESLMDSQQLINKFVEVTPFTRHFDIVSFKLQPAIFLKALVRGVDYQTTLLPAVFEDFYVKSDTDKSVGGTLYDRPTIRYIPFIYPYAYYPLYIPMFPKEIWNLE